MQRFTLSLVLRSAAFSALGAGIVFLSGCANMTGTAPPTSFDGPHIKGSLYGGQQPIAAGHVYMYAANSSAGYGSASTSLLDGTATGTTVDGSGNAYLTTDANGSFSYTGTFPCTPGTQIYLLALGGNPEGTPTGPENGAIALSAALGDCANVNSSTVVNIDEVTTVAMAYALNSFMVDATHVGAPTTNVPGLKAAFATVNNLVNTSNGTALLATPAGTGVAPQQYVNTLANIIASCINSGSAASSPCTQLFANATVAPSPAPGNTLSALINIAAFPAAQTANLYALVSPAAPFQPSLAVQPNDFAIGITYTPAAITPVQPSNVVIDATGNIWMANCQSCISPTGVDSLLEFSSNGDLLHSYTGSAVPTTQVLHSIKGIALDAAGANIYTVNQGLPSGTVPGTGDDQIIKMNTSTGVVAAGFPLDLDSNTYGSDVFNGIAVDNDGEIWAAGGNSGAILETTPSGLMINGSPFFIAGTTGIGVDNQGNIWFAGTQGNDLLQWDTFGEFLADYNPSGYNQPLNIAINQSNEIWSINVGNQSLSKIESADGTNGSGSPYTGLGLNQATVTAIDGTNQVVIPNCRVGCVGSGSTLHDSLLRLAQAGTPNTGASGTDSGVQLPDFNGVAGAAVDAAGNVWVANSANGKLIEVIGFAAPTNQPLAAASTASKIGQKP